MQMVEVVVLAEGVERDLPVGGDRVDVRLAERLPVGEVEHRQLVGEAGPEVRVDVDRRPGPQAADDEAVALGDRQLDQALVLPAHAVERVGDGDADQLSLEVVGPRVERTREAAGARRRRRPPAPHGGGRRSPSPAPARRRLV